MEPHVPLWVKSNFSFLTAASHPAELVERAHEIGLPAVALTDRDGVHGIVQAHVTAKELGIRLLAGAEITVGDPARPPDGILPADAKRVVLLAEDRTGWANLCRLISRGRARCAKGSSIVGVEETAEAAPGLFAVCPDVRLLGPLADAYRGRIAGAVVRHLRFDEKPAEARMRAVARRMGIPLVGTTEVLYHVASRRPLLDVLTCIGHGVTLDAAGTRLRANAEHHLLTPHVMRELFADDPRLLSRSREIAQRCRFSLSEIRYRYPAERRPEGTSERDWLRALTLEGAAEHYGGSIPGGVLRQIEKELVLIEELDYGGYFLTMYEIVQFCRRADILCQGRGSAANSAVCYCLGITAVDPVRMDLLFERFLSRERNEPPDIDLDIEHDRREEVIQWVYERYGRRHAAMIANVIRYRTRSAVRDVGKALGIADTALDRLAKLLGSRFADLQKDALVHSGLDPDTPVSTRLLELVREIREFPRHLSIHPGGFLLGHEPVDTLVPIEPATMEGRTVIQWDKYSVEDLGLFKVDLLGLGALRQAHLAFDLLREHEGVDLDLSRVPPEDPATYEMVSRGDTVGVFQIESRAQMSMLPRLRPRTFYDLVVEVAIVRPGPIQGDMVHPYLRRRSGEEPETYPHPLLERALKKTLGVPIFQEQVMKIAVLVGGYTGGEADQLRRDMAAWKSSGRIDRHKDKLIGRMRDNGIDAEFAERIFSQIRGFGEYGFPESHAASFALIAYVTSWLKCHHPAAFACSLLNAQPMGFYAPSTIVEDAKRHGVRVLPVDACASSWDCTLERSQGRLAVRMGFRYVQGLGARERRSLEAAPRPWTDLDRFVRGTQLSAKPLQRLAEAGAFECFGLSRRDALWAVREAAARAADSLALPAADTDTPFFRPLAVAEQVLWDYGSSRHSARGHPMIAVREELARRKIPDAVTVNARRNGSRARYVGLVICRQQPGTSTGVTFYTLEDETGFVNAVVWRPIFEKHSVVARTATVLGITGKIQKEHGVVHLVAEELWDPELSFVVEGSSTRSFH
ncbi:MAG: error-prone DNA polymerase [Candidatus Eiseniibacteriota bacterium]